ncbi:uncharacterized protein SOCE26_036050 [Sorangium cellulosum]|uniref:Uncharacterized protein n=1 Tax=Sorangium cellulosum TaxID=56 RepID=A0A2L0ES79_SORCE|nr:hypothetical protein [Sorangium cellulosum]AUX42178.1 uncharacterized protein SOCE26_036050 [Sorangium cellulosum]
MGGLGGAGCFVDSEGLSPPTDGFYYPTGLAVSPGGRVLYVANSDFDLQYNGGTVQALDLQRLRKRALEIQRALNPAQASEGGVEEGAAADVSAACGSLGPNDAPVLYPGPCAPLDVASLDGDEEIIRRSAIVGAFASDVLLTHSPPDQRGARMFVPVRGDPSVTYFEIADDRGHPASPEVPPCSVDTDEGTIVDCFYMNCGPTDRCSRENRLGEDPVEGVGKLPLEPFDVAASPDGTTVVVSHQTEDKASLITNPWGPGTRPQLSAILSDLPAQPTELAAVPPPRLVTQLAEAKKVIDYQPGFLLTFIAAPQVDLIRASSGAAPTDPPATLFRSATTPISAVASGEDARGIAVDASERQACEAGCGGPYRACAAACREGCSCDCDGDDTCQEACDACEASCDEACLDPYTTCLAGCAEIPLLAFVAHRYPSSLLIGEVRTTLVEKDGSWVSGYETLAIHDAVPLAAFPSRVAVGDVIDADGALRRRAFAVAFDTGLAFSYDPEARRIDAVIRTGRGPQAIAFDTGVTCTSEREDCDCAADPQGPGCRSYSMMYIAHFTDSYLGVVDLDMRNANTFGSMILTVGRPVPPRESQ